MGLGALSTSLVLWPFIKRTMQGKIFPRREPFYTPEFLSPARWICKAHFPEDGLWSHSQGNREFTYQPNSPKGRSNIDIYPGGRVVVPLGFGLGLPLGLAMTMGGIVDNTLKTGVQVITSTAGGLEEDMLAKDVDRVQEELVAVLINHSTQAVNISEGDAICHLLFHETPAIRWEMKKG